MMARLRTNRPLVPLETVEQAKADPWDGLSTTIMDAARAKWFVGDGATVRAELAAFAERWGVDEVMISPVAGAYDGEPLDTAPGRIRSLELLSTASVAA
jgi:alkanesulfonate monooxygenase SsuD/methylene tetrahydromethanopterin reductase-like flavin-dependent oxidoreductase (luciferase family)